MHAHINVDADCRDMQRNCNLTHSLFSVVFVLRCLCRCFVLPLSISFTKLLRNQRYACVQVVDYINRTTQRNIVPVAEFNRMKWWYSMCKQICVSVCVIPRSPVSTPPFVLISLPFFRVRSATIFCVNRETVYC